MLFTYFVAKKIRRASGSAFTKAAHRVGVVTIAIGAATILIAFATMMGFRQNIEKRLIDFSGHLQIEKYTLNKSYESTPLHVQNIEKIQAILHGSLQSLQLVAYKPGLLQTASDVEGIVLKGTNLPSSPNHLAPYLVAGSFPHYGTKKYSQAIVLSHLTAAKLRLHVGDTVMLCIIQNPPRYRKLKVSGIYTSHIANIDETLAFCDLRLLQRLNGWAENTLGCCEVFLSDILQMPDASRKLWEQLSSDLEIQHIQERYRHIFDWLLVVQKNAWIFMVLILLVVSANIASIVLIQLTERIKMLSILYTLGASRWQISKIMLWGNLHLVAKGLILGNSIGIGVCLLQAYGHFIPLDATQYYIDYVPILLQYRAILLINGVIFTVVMGVVSFFLLVLVRIQPSSTLAIQ